MRHLGPLILPLILVGTWVPHADAAPARYLARLQNGSYVEGESLSEWHSPESKPKLDSQPLLDPANPFRWLVDRTMPPPALPGAYVELVTGDRLPGEVVEYRAGNDSPFAMVPAHFVVRYQGVQPSNFERQPVLLRVESRFVRRMVWETKDTLQADPQTIVLRDGSEMRFRSLRLSGTEFRLLLDQGIRQVPFRDVAQVCFPEVDFWPTWWEELARLAPDAEGRLIQLETTAGLAVTASLSRYLPRTAGDAKDASRWVHGIHPAWCLDVIWVPQSTVWMRRSFTPQELPLSRVPLSRSDSRPGLGGVRFPPRINRNVAGGPLRSGRQDAGWGLGVHGATDLEFELPAQAKSLRTEFSLDATMQEGGCVQPRVLNASANHAVLYQGPVVVGAENVVDTGTLALTAAGDVPRRVVLQVDPVLANRPPGADPFDIRDHANWLDPIVELDLGRLKTELAARLMRPPMWQDWQLAAHAGSLTWDLFFAEAPGNSGEFQLSLATREPVTLTRQAKLRPDDRWLVVDAVRVQSSGPPVKLEARIGGEPVTEYELPVIDKSRSDFRPLVVRLPTEKSPPASTPLELRLLPTPENATVWWRTLTTSAQHPLLYQFFEDRWPGTENGSLAAFVDAQQHFSGTASLKLGAGQGMDVPCQFVLRVRERPQLGDYRFLRLVLRKPGGGGMRMTFPDAGQGETLANAVYEAGPNPPADPTIKRLTSQPLDSQWQVITRDLYGDFGNLDLQSVRLECLEGEPLWVDHVYFARTQRDFDLIDTIHASSGN